jgi:hypothetical protein
MARINGSLARKLDFGELTVPSTTTLGSVRLRLLEPSRPLQGPDKYKVLEHRRRQAQIRARRLLEIV